MVVDSSAAVRYRFWYVDVLVDNDGDDVNTDNTCIFMVSPEDYRPVQACTSYRKTAAGVKFKLGLVTGIAAIRSGR
eukprot:SAG31_NODE_223_length_19859_cov_14.949899_11_plen_76_part_00